MIVDSRKNTINNNIRTDVCPCCKSRLISKIGTIKYAKDTAYSSTQIVLTEIPELWRCNECQSCFTQNRVSETDSISLYSRGNSWSSESFANYKTQATVDLIESLVKPGCKMLDIGCANGAMLDYAKQRGAITSGLEYSRANLDELRRKEHTAYADWAQVNDRFNIITAFDVVEHLYDLESFLDSCLSHLSDDGLLVFMTGDISSWSAKMRKSKWWYVRFPEHVLFPSTSYFESLTNLKVVTIVRTLPSRSIVYPQVISFIKNLTNTLADHVIVVLKRNNK